MARIFLAAMLALFAGLGAARAQQAADSAQGTVWVQIEAQPNLNAVNEALRRRSASLQDVNGFDLDGSSWYVVALGPYDPATAQEVLSVLRRNGRIPRDSYIAESVDYARQIWPVGAELPEADTTADAGEDDVPESDDSGLGDALAAMEDSTADTPEVAPEPEAAPEPAPEPAGETPREARQSEARLTRAERKDLQVALKWAGHYRGRIDAQFGRGTRSSMTSWQEANGHEKTGVLTTSQRAELLRQYNAVLDGMGMERVADAKMGIAMQVPLGVVEFARYQPPFAQFDATGDIPARVLMISQEGTKETLQGLYNIMQTLEIVPQDGQREMGRDSFSLTGENAEIVSHTEARLENGRIKGFTFVWPAGDEERRSRILGLMQESFTRTDGVLDPGAGANDAQSVDLVSGLEVRRPEFSRSGFYVDGRGTVVTTAEFDGACGHVTIEDDQQADVVASDADLGVAVLRPKERLSPVSVAALRTRTPRIQSQVTLAGYSYSGVLGAPSLTRGTVSDIRGLDGGEDVNRLALDALEGDAGGPVMDAGGAVLGMLLPRRKGTRTLPEDVAFAAGSDALARLLSEAGITAATASGQSGALTPARMSERAAGMTVLVSCWK